MAYSNFTMNQLRREYGLNIVRQNALFADVPPEPLPDWLRDALDRQTELALQSNSEKARSELLIMPILMAVYERMRERVNIFSGVEFNVDAKRGLVGFCDFLFTLAPRSMDIQAPFISVVTARNEDILKGIPQCLAELVGAQIYNAEKGRSIETFYGVVTNGAIWKFLRLEGTQVTVDDDHYYITEVEKIVGILVSMLQ